MTKTLAEVLLSHDPVLIAAAKARYRKELIYLPHSDWKRRLIELNERSDRL